MQNYALLNLLLFAFLSLQASNRGQTIEPDMPNHSCIERKMKFSFSASPIKQSIRNGKYGDKITYNEQIIFFDSDETIKKILTEKNALNKIITHYCSKPTYLVNDSIVYLLIPSISDIHPSKCTIMKNQQTIDNLEKIKALNTNDEFEIEGKKIKDPFRLSESIHAYREEHLNRIFAKIYCYSIGLSTISTLILLGKNKPMPIIPTTTFFVPLLIHYKVISFWLKSTFIEMFADNNKLRFFALISIFFIAPVFAIYGINILLHCVRQKMFV